ncbi:MAG TPA: hypothetical protein PLT08_00190 [Anaerolineales bacterium]|jgi:hypothetical protein|nr:hypothetical protein [Anaerolineales bacterium]
MGLDFILNNGGRRSATDITLPIPYNYSSNRDNNLQNEVDLELEMSDKAWQAINIVNTLNWRPIEWEYSPIRFVDGKDVGQTVAWVYSPDGYPVPIRLSQIGSIVMNLENGEIRRDYSTVDRVVSMVVDPFSWEDIEGFARSLQANGIRLLPAYPLDPNATFEFEKLRQASQDRTREEMSVLEEAAIARNNNVPTVIDGRLDKHSGGFDRSYSPVFGVIKTHYQNYLNRTGMQVLYDLKAGERTPFFRLTPNQRPSVITWYLRLSDAIGTTPTWGFIRIEVSQDWFFMNQQNENFVNRLSRAIYEYRCKESSYRRAPVSIHPIVRAEESLGSQYQPDSQIIADFYRQSGI